jgi:hypothetical protein
LPYCPAARPVGCLELLLGKGRDGGSQIPRQLLYACDGRAALLRCKGLRTLEIANGVAESMVRCHADILEQISVCWRYGVVAFARLHLQPIPFALDIDLAVRPVQLVIGGRITGDVLSA